MPPGCPPSKISGEGGGKGAKNSDQGRGTRRPFWRERPGAAVPFSVHGDQTPRHQVGDMAVGHDGGRVESAEAPEPVASPQLTLFPSKFFLLRSSPFRVDLLGGPFGGCTAKTGRLPLQIPERGARPKFPSACQVRSSREQRAAVRRGGAVPSKNFRPPNSPLSHVNLSGPSPRPFKTVSGPLGSPFRTVGLLGLPGQGCPRALGRRRGVACPSKIFLLRSPPFQVNVLGECL